MVNGDVLTQEQLRSELAELRQRLATLEDSHAKLRRQRDELREENERQDKALQSLSYHFQNSLVPVVGLLYMKRRKIQTRPPLDYKEMLASLISQVSATSVIYRLYADYEWEDIPLTTLANRVIRETLQNHPTPAPIALEIEESPVRVPVDQAKNLALILNELTLNPSPTPAPAPAATSS
jgi:two-component sensor histidine kinase